MPDCKTCADDILLQIKNRVKHNVSHGYLVVISVGENAASQSYIRGKKKDCEAVGFRFTEIHFDEADTVDIQLAIKRAAMVKEVTGIIVQLPLPENINKKLIQETIPRELDVDGFRDDSPFKPCTPEAVIYILKDLYGNDLSGLTAMLIGRGELIGKPLLPMLIAENMSVFQVHSKSKWYDISWFADSMADVVITGVGKPEIFEFNTNWHTTFIDCGCSRDKDGHLHGDISRDSAVNKTPVPGGMGLMTRAMLMLHCERRYANETSEDI